MSQILLVEDDDAIARPLTAALRNTGHEVRHVATGMAALEHAGEAELIVLDLGLPDLDGLEVCRLVRERGHQVPILVLTARTSEADLVVALDAGADDYVAKPFRLAELQARIRALLRRSVVDEEAAGGRDEMIAQDVVVQRGARRALRAGVELELTPKEFDLLAELVANAGRVVTREQLMERVWDERWFGSTKTLDVHVSALRRKLGDDPAHPRYVSTVRGVGLRFEQGG